MCWEYGNTEMPLGEIASHEPKVMDLREKPFFINAHFSER